MDPPEKPLATDCCGTGCSPCVYDIYLDELEIYRAWKKKNEASKQDEKHITPRPEARPEPE